MRLRPKESTGVPGYPTLADHKLARRSFLRGLGRAAVGVGLSAGTVHAAAAGGRKPKSKAAAVKPKRKLEDEVAELVAQLGDGKFRVRESATTQLIAIGKDPERLGAKGRKGSAVVLDAMAPLAKHEDVEVRERSKRIALALQPPKPVPPKVVPHVAGGIRIRGKPRQVPIKR
jgi:hypothetical protein